MKGWTTCCLHLCPYWMLFLLGCDQKWEQDFVLHRAFSVCKPLHALLSPTIDFLLSHWQLCDVHWPMGRVQWSKIWFVTCSRTWGLLAAWLHVPWHQLTLVLQTGLSVLLLSGLAFEGRSHAWHGRECDTRGLSPCHQCQNQPQAFTRMWEK